MLQQETREMDGHYEFVTVSDEATIAFRHYGTPGKPRLLLIHSLALDGSIWTDVISGLQGQAEIICIDCRGHEAPGNLRDQLLFVDHCKFSK